ncbi:MAG: peptidylprolyl isomerase [Chloroflexota bacterium]
MSYSKRLRFRLLLLLVALVGAAACSPGSANSGAAPTSAPAVIQTDSLPKNDAGVSIVARVNDVDITLPQYQRMVESNQLLAPGGANAPNLILQTLIQQALIEQSAAQYDIVVTPEQVSQELQGLIESAGGADAWQSWLTQNNYTEDDLRTNLRDSLLTSRLRDRITGDLSSPVPQIHARHILVTTQEQANDLLVRLRNGEDFAALAQQYSLDTSTAVNGGDLGWFTNEELLEPTLSQVAFQLQPGQIAGPIQTSLGYHIIQTIESATREIDPEKRAQLGQSRFEAWLNTLTATAKIEQYL